MKCQSQVLDKIYARLHHHDWYFANDSPIFLEDNGEDNPSSDTNMSDLISYAVAVAKHDSDPDSSLTNYTT